MNQNRNISKIAIYHDFLSLLNEDGRSQNLVVKHFLHLIKLYKHELIFNKRRFK